jgi:hypothetical protein
MLIKLEFHHEATDSFNYSLDNKPDNFNGWCGSIYPFAVQNEIGLVSTLKHPVQPSSMSTAACRDWQRIHFGENQHHAFSLREGVVGEFFSFV